MADPEVSEIRHQFRRVGEGEGMVELQAVGRTGCWHGAPFMDNPGNEIPDAPG
jgi:hypothetical protein